MGVEIRKMDATRQDSTRRVTKLVVNFTESVLDFILNRNTNTFRLPFLCPALARSLAKSLEHHGRYRREMLQPANDHFAAS